LLVIRALAKNVDGGSSVKDEEEMSTFVDMKRERNHTARVNDAIEFITPLYVCGMFFYYLLYVKLYLGRSFTRSLLALANW